jgi:hypothetical protein
MKKLLMNFGKDMLFLVEMNKKYILVSEW